MRKIYLFALIIMLLQLCGCNSKQMQDKAEVTPYSHVDKICYKKEVFNIKGVELSSPQQIASYGDILFICDAGNSRIIKCDLQGNAVMEIGKLGTMPGGFVEPVCIALSSSQICVYDRGSNRIQALTFDGEPIWEYNIDEKFNFLSEIVDVEISENGSVYFSLIAYDKHTSSSGVYMLKDGNIIKVSNYTVGSLAADENNIYFMSKYELKGDNSWISGYAELLKITEEKSERVSAFSDSYSAIGLECFDGKLYAYNDCLQSVDAFSTNGEYIATVFSEPVVNDFVYKGFCSDKDGNLYLSDSKGNTIYKLVKND